MLGLSLSKVLFTIAIVVGVWKAFGWAKYFKEKLADDEDAPVQKRASTEKVKAEPPKRPPEPPAKRSVELVACPICGDYVANGTFCGSKEACKYRK